MADSSYDVQSTVGPVWPARPAMPVRRDEKGSDREEPPAEREGGETGRSARADGSPSAPPAGDPAEGLDDPDPPATRGQRIDAYA